MNISHHGSGPTAPPRSAPKSSAAKHVVSAKSAVCFSYAVLPEEFAVIEVAISRSNPAPTEPVFAIEVTKLLAIEVTKPSSVAWCEDSISKGNAIRTRPAAVEPAVTRVMAIDKHSTLPAHVTTVESASTL